MMVVCDGRRMGKRALAELLGALDLDLLAESLIDGGFHLLPPRAPRGLTRGRLSIRLVWQKRIGDAVQTVRITTVMQHPKAA